MQEKEEKELKAAEDEKKEKGRHRKATIIIAIIVIGAILLVAFLFMKGNKAEGEGEETEAELSIYDLSPIDEEGKKKVEQAEALDEDDTWTICYYFVGSDLEDQGENDLSELTKLMTEEAAGNNKKNTEKTTKTLLYNYAEQLQRNGLDFPEYLYEPVRPTASGEAEAAGTILAEMNGAASDDISEICKGVSSDKINVVIQTGGATRWGNSLINPNKTQRFTVKDGYLDEIQNMPLQDSCDPDTLADFLKFCDEEYPADHRILVLWDHGGGAMGYGQDDIYNSSMSLENIQNALSQVCSGDAENPYYDIIGFDACLMASLENAHSLYGYGRYLVGCEETEPGGGWSHDVYLEAMSNDPTMSPAAIGEKIVDSFVDFYMEKNCEMGNIPLYSITTSFSLIDLNAAEEAYQAYCDLNEKLLQDAVADNSLLTKIGTAAQDSTRLSGEAYKIYNLIDLGNYMEALSAYYPEECGKVLEKTEDAVLYHRSNGYLSEAEGINVYMPVTINDTNGLNFFLTYTETISEDMATRALYYYKVSGCLNEKYQAYADEAGYGKAKNLDTEALKEVSSNPISLEEGAYQISLTDEQKENYQSLCTETAGYDEEKNLLTYYGKSLQAEEKDGKITASFDGKWISMDGVALYTEIISESDEAIVYRSPVMINDENYYLLFSYDKESGNISLNGASIYNADALADASAAHVIGKTTISLEEGDQITPVYQVYDLQENKTSRQESEEKISFSSSSKVALESLPDGKYLNAIVLTDVRGDDYYSGVVEETIADGSVTKQEISQEFVGRSY